MYNKLKLHIDMFIRTICIVIVINMLIAMSSKLGTLILVANIILLQFKGFVTYCFEGVATATAIIARKSMESKNKYLLQETHRLTMKTVMYLSVGWGVFYQLERIEIINCVTQIEELKSTIRSYDGWIMMYAIIGGWGLSSNGLYRGVNQTKPIRYAYIIALVIFVVSCLSIKTYLYNHGLWLALVLFYLISGCILMAYEGNLDSVIEDFKKK